jgi:hypothetical protein
MIAKKKMRVTVRNVHARFHPKKKKFDDFWFVSYYHYYSYRLFYDKVICFFLNSQIHNSYTVPFVSKKIPWGCIFVVYPYMHKFVNVERKFGPLISRPHIAMHDACAHCFQCRPQRICVNSSSCVVARAGLSALVSHRIRMATPGHSSLRSGCVVHVYRTPAPHSYLIWGQGDTVACGLRPGLFLRIE